MFKFIDKYLHKRCIEQEELSNDLLNSLYIGNRIANILIKAYKENNSIEWECFSSNDSLIKFGLKVRYRPDLYLLIGTKKFDVNVYEVYSFGAQDMVGIKTIKIAQIIDLSEPYNGIMTPTEKAIHNIIAAFSSNDVNQVLASKKVLEDDIFV